MHVLINVIYDINAKFIVKLEESLKHKCTKINLAISIFMYGLVWMWHLFQCLPGCHCSVAAQWSSPGYLGRSSTDPSEFSSALSSHRCQQRYWDWIKPKRKKEWAKTPGFTQQSHSFECLQRIFRNAPSKLQREYNKTTMKRKHQILTFLNVYFTEFKILPVT